MLIPANVRNESSAFTGAIGFRVGRKTGIDEVGRISHPHSYGISRALVIGDALYTVSGSRSAPCGPSLAARG